MNVLHRMLTNFRYWTGLIIFYHEFGHALLKNGHVCDSTLGDIMQTTQCANSYGNYDVIKPVFTPTLEFGPVYFRNYFKMAVERLFKGKNRPKLDCSLDSYNTCNYNHE